MTAPARPAATVVLIRPQSSTGWETYLLRRSAQSPVLADLWVFPGGTVRADDLGPEAERAAEPFSLRQAHAALSREPGVPAATPRESLGCFVAAARELFEEAGVLLGAFSDHEEHPELRRAVEQGRPFAEAVAELGARLALDRLIYYAHWTTPEAAPQRFDARFFITLLPEGQTATPSPFEMAEGIWITAAAALERSGAGELPLHFATLNHLRRLARCSRLDDLLEAARTKPVVPVMPHTREENGRIVPFLPPDLDGVW